MPLDVLAAPSLATKFKPVPARRIRVDRSRLTALCEQANCLTLISAPAGYGKTTLAADFLQSVATHNPAARLSWFSLDAADDDPPRFSINFITALQTASPALGETMLALLQSSQPPLKLVTTQLVNEISSLNALLVCVLDDYHLITVPSIHAALIDLLEHSPANLHLILTTRVDPPFPLARWRARNQLIEIRADELRFTAAEATVFLNQVMGLRLSVEQIAALGSRTEGWVAGLQLAGLSLQKRDDVDGFVADFAGSHRYMLDYLMEEVWRFQSEAVQDFLLKTSILERLCAPLCEAVMGEGASAAALLEELERANLFLVPLDADRQWYRYHLLLTEAMQAQLLRGDPELVPVLHQRASRWFEQENDMDSAIHHALAAQDFERAADLIERHTAWWVRNEVGTLTRWLALIPESVIRTRPRLIFNQAWSLLSNSRVDEAEACLDKMEQELDMPQSPWADWRVRITVEILTIRSAIARHRSDTEQAIRYGWQALELMPPEPMDLRAATTMHLGNAYLFQCDLDAATQTLTQALETSLASGHSFVYLSAQHSLALIQMMRGQLRAAESTYLQSQRFVRGQRRPVLSGLETIGLAEIYREWNEFARAEVVLAEGLALAEKGGSAAQIRLGYLAGARLKQSQRSWVEAESFLDRAAQLTFEGNAVNASIITISRARLALACGDPEGAQRWLQNLSNSPGRLEFVRDMERAAQARIWLATGNYAAARKLLNEWQAVAQKGGRYGRLLEAQLLSALSDWQRGHHASAQKSIGRVLAQAAPEGYINLFVEEGEPMFALLTAFSQLAPPSSLPYLQKLLAAFPVQALMPASMPILTDTLSERELEILRLLAEGQSYREIAQALTLAYSTVQSYIRGLYRKLGAHSGREAVARARVFRLIP